MTWVYDQSSGELTHNGTHVATGYSGYAKSKNDPDDQALVARGPIPRGKWKIGMPYTSPNTGPYTMRLDPEAGTETEGRSEFRVHGDSIAHPGDASHGCVILARPIREQIWNSGDHELEVIR